MTDEDKIKLKKFNQSIIDNPRPMDEQWSETKDGKIWCSDWEIIEILKYMFNGRSMYMEDPPPNRLKNNPLFDKNKIAGTAEFLLKHYKGDADAIIERLRNERTQGLQRNI